MDRYEYNTPLAPWERELLSMVHTPEPYVDAAVTFNDGEVETFFHVRGFKHEDNMLTFEDEEGRLFYVPNVRFWSNSYCEQ